MKISVLSLFRDSVPYLADCFRRLSDLEKNTNAEFSYYFYENDSVDDTRANLINYSGLKGGKQVAYETLGTPKFGSVSTADRFTLMSYYRNTLLATCRNLDSDYTLLLDSDVQFGPDLINDYLKIFNEDHAMLTCNTVAANFKCIMCCNKPVYYDSLACQDMDGNPIMTWSHNPFYNPEDRRYWDAGIPVKVNRAFGGAALVRTKVLATANWDLIDPNSPTCEHHGFCDKVRQYGEIFVVPTIISKVYVPGDVLKSIPQSHIQQVGDFQRSILRDHFNIELKK